MAVQNADRPAEFGEASVPGADVALGVGVHVGVAGVPEEPDVFVVGDGLGMEEDVVDNFVWAPVEEVGGDWVESWWDWVVFGVHCVYDLG